MLLAFIAMISPFIVLGTVVNPAQTNNILFKVVLWILTEVAILWVIGQQLFSVLLLIVYVGAVLVLLLVLLSVLKPEKPTETRPDHGEIFFLSLFVTFVFLMLYPELVDLVTTTCYFEYEHPTDAIYSFSDYLIKIPNVTSENSVDNLAEHMNEYWVNVYRAASTLLVGMFSVITVMVGVTPEYSGVFAGFFSENRKSNSTTGL